MKHIRYVKTDAEVTKYEILYYSEESKGVTLKKKKAYTIKLSANGDGQLLINSGYTNYEYVYKCNDDTFTRNSAADTVVDGVQYYAFNCGINLYLKQDFSDKSVGEVIKNVGYYIIEDGVIVYDSESEGVLLTFNKLKYEGFTNSYGYNYYRMDSSNDRVIDGVTYYAYEYYGYIYYITEDISTYSKGDTIDCIVYWDNEGQCDGSWDATITVFKYDPSYVGPVQEYISYSAGDDQVLTCGSEVMNVDGNWNNNTLTAITIPDSVTTIGEGAFSSCTRLTSVTIPNSVTSIGNYAFSDCTSLETINYNGTMEQWKSITLGTNWNYNVPATIIHCTDGDLDLYGKIYYTSTDGNVVTPKDTTVFGANIVSNIYENGQGIITFDGDVTSIGNLAFCQYKRLTSITIPDSVTTIGNMAFADCTVLTSVTIGNSVTTIGDSAFSGCTLLTSVTIPDSVTTIGEYTFNYCTGLTSITIPNSVTTIGNSAFEYCGKLTSVTIPDSVTTIGEYTFNYCTGLTSITIPDSVTTIGNMSFANCMNIQYIKCESMIAPSLDSNPFGGYDDEYTGRNTYNLGINILEVPEGATGYNTGYWKKTLCNSSKCGFTLIGGESGSSSSSK